MGVERQYQLRRRIEDLLSEVGQVRAELRAERVEALTPGRHASDRPKLRLIRGGKALALAPVMWVWAQVREHATAATGIATAGVIGSASTLGVAAVPEVGYNPPPRSTTAAVPAAVAGQPELRPTSSSAVTPRPSQVPTPAPTETAEAVESETTPPESPAPASVPTPTPTPDAINAPVEVVVWTRTAALVHCRDVLEVPPANLQGCVQELLAG